MFVNQIVIDNRFAKCAYRCVTLVILGAFCVACSYQSAVHLDKKQIDIPNDWEYSDGEEPISNGWAESLNSPRLIELIDSAIANNAALEVQRLGLLVAQQELIVAGSGLWPDSDLSIVQSKTGSEGLAQGADQTSIELGISYEIDLWGKLSALEQEAHLNYLAMKSRYEYQVQNLAADVARAWLKVIEIEQLLKVLDKRVNSAVDNLATIEQGYSRGLLNALDVYLARNDMHAEKANLSDKGLALVRASRNLERLIGVYPSGNLEVDVELPAISNSIAKGLPSDLIDRHPLLAASWSDLLARDARLAFAHRQRLPSLSLNSSLVSNGTSLSEAASGAPLVWSILSSITAPIFSAGKLKAQEEIAKLELKKAEKLYLDLVYDTFLEIENGIHTERSLSEQLKEIHKSEHNAEISVKLSMDQYRRGLTAYSNVLDARERYYSAKVLRIETQSQLLSNRIQLHVSLGGSFSKSRI